MARNCDKKNSMQKKKKQMCKCLQCDFYSRRNKSKTLYINLINKLRIIYNKKWKRKFIIITKNKIEILRNKYVSRYMISQYR